MRLNHTLIKNLKGYALCRRPLLAPRICHLGSLVSPFLQPGDHFWTSGALGEHFGTSGPPWRTMGAAGWTRGGAEQDDGKHSLE